MNERQVAEAVRDWALDEIDELKSGYAYPVATKLGELPDIVAVVKGVSKVRDDDRFPFAALDQTWLRVFEVEASVMVGVDDADDFEAAEDAHREAHETLEAIGAQLRELPEQDPTLGDRLDADPGQVAFVSPLIGIGYDPPFAELEDGTRGRFLFVSMAIAETIPEPG